MIDRICAEVDKHQDQTIELLQRLIRINTANPYCGDATASSEEEGQLALLPVLEQMGAKVNMFDCPDDIYDRMGIIGPKARCFKDRPNLVAELKFGDGPKRVMLMGHMDTVGGADMEIEPFGGEVKDGKVWGRGTSDCKGGLASGVAAMQALLPLADQLDGTLIFESVVDEECNGSGAGTLACCDAGYAADVCISLDGNDLTITRGCNGCLTADVHVEGLAGHAARGTGVNAIDKGMIVKHAIDRFKEARETAHPDCKLNLGIFQAGVHPAVVPAKAWLSLNMVYDIAEAVQADGKGLGYGAAEIRVAFEEAIAEACRADEWLAEHPAQVEWVKDLIPFETPEDADAIAGLRAAGAKALGRDIPVHWMVAWSDVAYLPRFANTPALLFGPGVGETCHAPVEYVPIENLTGCAKAVAAYAFEQLKR